MAISVDRDRRMGMTTWSDTSCTATSLVQSRLSKPLPTPIHALPPFSKRGKKPSNDPRPPPHLHLFLLRAQYPLVSLNIHLYCRLIALQASQGNILALQVDSKGNVRYDAIAHQGQQHG